MSDIEITQDVGVMIPAVPRPTPWAKKAAVMAELGRLPRNGRHQDQGWTYLRGDDLFEALRPLLAKHGLVPTFQVAAVEPRAIERKVRDGQTVSTSLIRVRVACALVDIDTGERIDAVEWPAEAHDGDKAIRVATSLAIAAWLETTLLVSSEDDAGDGYDDNQDAPPPIRPRQPDKASAEAARIRSKVLATAKAAGIPDSDLWSACKKAGVAGLFKDCHDVLVLRRAQEAVEEMAKAAATGGRA